MNEELQWYDERLPQFEDAGNFKAIISASAERSRDSNWRGFSACVAEVQLIGANLRRRLVDASEKANSTEKRGYVAAVASVVEALMPGSEVTIYCREEYICNALNLWLRGWADNNWKKSDGKDVAAKEIWAQVLRVIDERHIGVTGIWIKKSDTELQRYVDRLLEEARERRLAQTKAGSR